MQCGASVPVDNGDLTMIGKVFILTNGVLDLKNQVRNRIYEASPRTNTPADAGGTSLSLAGSFGITQGSTFTLQFRATYGKVNGSAGIANPSMSTGKLTIYKLA